MCADGSRARRTQLSARTWFAAARSISRATCASSLAPAIGRALIRARAGGEQRTLPATRVTRPCAASAWARLARRAASHRVALTFRGDNDTHHVSLDAGQWHCTCHYFDSWRTCVHVLTLQKIMGVMLPEEAQESIFSAQAVPA